jgi:integrase
LAKVFERAGIKDFRLHDLRHTYVSNARRAEVDRTVIMKLTGHKTLAMFTRCNSVD